MIAYSWEDINARSLVSKIDFWRRDAFGVKDRFLEKRCDDMDLSNGED